MQTSYTIETWTSRNEKEKKKKFVVFFYACVASRVQQELDRFKRFGGK